VLDRLPPLSLCMESSTPLKPGHDSGTSAFSSPRRLAEQDRPGALWLRPVPL